MQLVKLSPEQVMNYWDDIRECISASLPPMIPENSDNLIFIQEQLLLGILECWVGMEPPRVFGVMTTQIIADSVSRCRNLLVYTLAMTDDHPHDMWQVCLEQMKKYASAHQCTNIIAYSCNPAMLHIAEKIGADTTYRLVQFKI